MPASLVRTVSISEWPCPKTIRLRLLEDGTHRRTQMYTNAFAKHTHRETNGQKEMEREVVGREGGRRWEGE